MSCSTSTAGSPTPSIPAASSAATTSTTAAAALPDRSRSYDIAGVDPCALLTPPQAIALGINQPAVGPKESDPGIFRCSFAVSPEASNFGISIDTTRGSAELSRNATPARTTTIDGVGALVIEGQGNGCTYALDVNDSQSLRALAGSAAASSEVDCPRAKALAESIMTTLDTLQPS